MGLRLTDYRVTLASAQRATECGHTRTHTQTVPNKCHPSVRVAL